MVRAGNALIDAHYCRTIAFESLSHRTPENEVLSIRLEDQLTTNLSEHSLYHQPSSLYGAKYPDTSSSNISVHCPHIHSILSSST